MDIIDRWLEHDSSNLFDYLIDEDNNELIINFRVIEEKNGSDFENFLETGIASIPVRGNPQ